MSIILDWKDWQEFRDFLISHNMKRSTGWVKKTMPSFICYFTIMDWGHAFANVKRKISGKTFWEGIIEHFQVVKILFTVACKSMKMNTKSVDPPSIKYHLQIIVSIDKVLNHSLSDAIEYF